MLPRAFLIRVFYATVALRNSNLKVRKGYRSGRRPKRSYAAGLETILIVIVLALGHRVQQVFSLLVFRVVEQPLDFLVAQRLHDRSDRLQLSPGLKIGRASCRERV